MHNCCIENHFAGPNSHVLTFLHPMLICKVTYSTPLELLLLGSYGLNQPNLGNSRYLHCSFFRGKRKKERCERVARHWDSPLALCPSPHPQIIWHCCFFTVVPDFVHCKVIKFLFQTLKCSRVPSWKVPYAEATALKQNPIFCCLLLVSLASNDSPMHQVIRSGFFLRWVTTHLRSW
jgi:hypothetical protein